MYVCAPLFDVTPPTALRGLMCRAGCERSGPLDPGPGGRRSSILVSVLICGTVFGWFPT